jgi:hypothetical protein
MVRTAEEIKAIEAQYAAIPNQVRYGRGWHYYPQPVDQIVRLTVGQKVKLYHDAGGRFWWTVRARTETTVVLTRQASFRKRGVLCYTVIDYRAGVRGPINVVGQGWDTNTDEECQELAQLVLDGEWEISQRNWVPIDLAEVPLP